MKETFQGDAELLNYFQRVVGYALSGHTSEQLLFFLFGPTQSGKSTTLAILQKLLRQYSYTLSAGAVLDGGGWGGANYSLANLPGVRIAAVNEPPRGRSFNVALLKNITGEDEIETRMIYDAPVRFLTRLSHVHARQFSAASTGRRIRILAACRRAAVRSRGAREGEESEAT